MSQVIHARQLLAADGWRQDAHIVISQDGLISDIGEGPVAGAVSVGALLPAPGNAHSHSFQRAMAGLSEFRGPDPEDNFWTWRRLMFRFAEILTPDDVESITAHTQMEMLESGYASVAEFHYLHQQPDGSPYDQIDEMSARVSAAAMQTGIGYTHLPVLYMRGGLDDRPLGNGQKRFACSEEQYADILDRSRHRLLSAPPDWRVGVAPHSLRAVSPQALEFSVRLSASGPIHIHIAEQTGEVESVVRAYGSRPVNWLLDHADVDDRWCLVHATHMDDSEVTAAAARGAVVCACPITESSLGDGILRAAEYLQAGGALAIGSDSVIRISLSEELRTLEHSQRLRDRRRVVLADQDRSCGRFLLEMAAAGGAKATGRDAGRIETGRVADLFALDMNDPALEGLSQDRLLDAWIFAGDDRLISDVWSAGRHVVKQGRHVYRDTITQRFNATMRRLRAAI
ncbi:MAG: formimidoylglutamate deiminase [Alphaproteobacteria bacterium HGW-Alphaproteobacteria-18]|nr:MAG: formimidoylglutamate deiminase [Alphaproteobacteria bacterium HGW-Alphaproteobacteria-18]